jgi:hypothetical protein
LIKGVTINSLLPLQEKIQKLSRQIRRTSFPKRQQRSKTNVTKKLPAIEAGIDSSGPSFDRAKMSLRSAPRFHSEQQVFAAANRMVSSSLGR